MPLSVLVVDDDAGFRRVMIRVLESMGFEVAGEVGTAAGALRSAADLRPDAVLVDIGLPDGDGTDLVPRLAALPWRPRIVLISSNPDAIAPADVERLGAAGFVPKTDLLGAPLRRLLSAG